MDSVNDDFGKNNLEGSDKFNKISGASSLWS